MSRKKQRKAKSSGCNAHHILHYRRWWDKGYKQKLRRVFVYELPVEVHEKLHGVVGPVPPLDEDEARWLWCLYNQEGSLEMGLFEALEWLQLHAPNAEFAIAIMEQSGFLRNHLGRS